MAKFFPYLVCCFCCRLSVLVADVGDAVMLLRLVRGSLPRQITHVADKHRQKEGEKENKGKCRNETCLTFSSAALPAHWHFLEFFLA